MTTSPKRLNRLHFKIEQTQYIGTMYLHVTDDSPENTAAVNIAIEGVKQRNPGMHLLKSAYAGNERDTFFHLTASTYESENALRQFLTEITLALEVLPFEIKDTQ